MALQQAAYTKASLTANGGTDGTLTVASTTGFVVGAIAYMNQTGATDATEVVITAIPDTTHIKVRVRVTTVPPNYTNSNMSSFLLANSASITQPDQTVMNGRVTQQNALV